MSAPSIQLIEDLSADDTEKLTQLLSLPPGTIPTRQWFREQTACLSNFPSSLLRPSSLLSRAMSSLPWTPSKAHLCKTHKQLNPHLIRRIFLQVCEECTTRIARLNEDLNLPANLAAFVKRIHSINSLWMAPDLYRAAFNTAPLDERFVRMPDGCEACILAAIGGNYETLLDLRACMIGRKKKRAPTPRLLKLVDVWIDWSERRERIRAESDALGREVRHCRQALYEARKQSERNKKEGRMEDHTPLLAQNTPNTPSSTTAVHDRFADGFEADARDTDESNEQNAENSVIDWYADVMSTTNRTNPLAQEDHHPAFRDSIVFSPQTGTFVRAGPEASRPTANSESMYSHPADGATSGRQQSTAGPESLTSEERAAAYRRLVGIDESEEPEDRRANKASRPNENRRGSRSTR